MYLDVKKTNDYLKLRSVFNSLDLIEEHSVLEMNNEYMKIRLKYKGKINKIRNKLLENKINIKIVDDTWKTTVN